MYKNHIQIKKQVCSAAVADCPWVLLTVLWWLNFQRTVAKLSFFSCCYNKIPWQESLKGDMGDPGSGFKGAVIREKSCQVLGAASHTTPAVTDNASVQLALSFLFSPGSKAEKLYHPTVGWVFPPQWTQNEANSSQVCREACLLSDSRSCQVDSQCQASQWSSLSVLYFQHDVLLHMHNRAKCDASHLYSRTWEVEARGQSSKPASAV